MAARVCGVADGFGRVDTERDEYIIASSGETTRGERVQQTRAHHTAEIGAFEIAEHQNQRSARGEICEANGPAVGVSQGRLHGQRRAGTLHISQLRGVNGRRGGVRAQ